MVEPLTDREQEILACLAEQLSNDEIAARLHLAEKTVRWYNTQIYGKLGVSGRKKAVEQARQLGLLGGRSAAQAKHNLPAPTTAFVGRERELARLTALLALPQNRLVTVLAPGGMGKTRLALAVARKVLGQYADGVFFISLAPLTEAAAVGFAIAKQVGLQFYGQEPPLRQLLTFLAPRALLLVLDNCEHLLEAAHTVSEILRAAPRVQILATSRERLGLQGETVYILRGLDFQVWENVADIEQSAAAALFLQCARRGYPDFRLQDGDLAHLAHICHLTAGMPLALELAAGWTNVLPLAQIAREVQQGIDILQTELRDVPDRHRSIRATFELTWQQLDAEERAVFMRLSVFRGGFTREAAAAIAGADRNHLRSFSSKALIETAEGDRYNIHELLCQFSAEKLAAAGEGAAVHAQHAAYFAAFMAECWQDMRTNRQLEALERVAADFENVRAAWLHALAHSEWEQLAGFLDPLRFYWEVRGPAQLGVELLEHAEQRVRAAPATPATELMLGRLLARLSWFYYRVGSGDGCAAAGDEAIRILRRHDNPADLLAALHGRWHAAVLLYRTDAGAQLMQEGISLAGSLGDKYWEAHLLLNLGYINLIQYHDLVSARLHAEAGLAIFESVGDLWGSRRGYGLLGEIEELEANYARAARHLQQANALAQTFGYRLNSGSSSTYLARVAFKQGNVAVARRHLCDALRTLLGGGILWQSTFSLISLSQMLAEQNEPAQAVEILGAVDRHLTRFQLSDQLAQKLKAELIARLGAEDFAAAWTCGQERELSTLIQDMLQRCQESADSGAPPIPGD